MENITNRKMYTYYVLDFKCIMRNNILKIPIILCPMKPLFSYSMKAIAYIYQKSHIISQLNIYEWYSQSFSIILLNTVSGLLYVFIVINILSILDYFSLPFLKLYKMSPN